MEMQDGRWIAQANRGHCSGGLLCVQCKTESERRPFVSVMVSRSVEKPLGS